MLSHDDRRDRHDEDRRPHRHDGAHSHAPADFGRAFAIGAALNVGFVLAEAGYGLLANSVALLADAGHNLGDVLALGAAWLASGLVKRAPTARFTYGLRGSSFLAALFNAVVLLLAVGAMSWEAVRRLAAPEPVAAKTVMIVAAVGIVVNGASAWLFASGRNEDINVRGAFLHMASDALASAGVAIAALIVLLTGWFRLDPVVSLAINVVIVRGAWGLLRDSLAMSMAAGAPGLDPVGVRRYLATRPGVAAIHDLHVWPMSTTETALTCHLVMPAGHPGDAFLHAVAAELGRRFKIGHTTLQIGTDPDAACALAPEGTV
ncbi:MAG: cation transporter [Hyphomicrobiales bacterium]|nr:cation transporter [Hyphomicrobiales bacterium]